MLESGCVMIHRSITSWEWYTDVPVRVLFEHLILTANWKDAKFRGYDIKRGERICSLQTLEEETGLTIQQLRTALSKLEKTGEIEKSKIEGKTRIRVVNFKKFQKINRRATCEKDTQQAHNSGVDDNGATFHQQTSNISSTNDQQGDKKDNKAINKIINNNSACAREVFSFPIKGGGSYTLTDEKHKDLSDMYPRIPLETEYKKMRAWLIDNKARQKTAAGMPRFISSWLSRVEVPQESEYKTYKTEERFAAAVARTKQKQECRV